MRSFAWELSFEVFRFETFAGNLGLLFFFSKLSPGIFSLIYSAWDVSFGDFRLGSFAWELSLGILRLGTTVAWDLQPSICSFWLKICGSRSVAQDLQLSIFGSKRKDPKLKMPTNISKYR